MQISNERIKTPIKKEVRLMEKVEMIPIEKVIEMRENDVNFKLVEVLGEDQYEEGHIPGAMNIPEDKLEDEAHERLEKHETIVVYCASYSCHASTNSARKLMDMGYKNVLDYKAGKKGWQHGGLKLES